MMEMKRNMKMADAVKALDAKMDAATVLSLIPIVRIRRLSSAMYMELPARIWRARKSEIIAAFVAGMEPDTMEIIARAAKIMCGWGWDAWNEAESFVAVLAKADEKTLAVATEGAARFVEITGRRNASQWLCGTPELDAESAAFFAAEAEMHALYRNLDAGTRGEELARHADARKAARKLAKAEVEGWTVSARVWTNYGKTRVYVRVYDANGREQLDALYIDFDRGGEVYWKGQPRKRPEWADAVVAAMKAAA